MKKAVSFFGSVVLTVVAVRVAESLLGVIAAQAAKLIVKAKASDLGQKIASI